MEEVGLVFVSNPGARFPACFYLPPSMLISPYPDRLGSLPPAPSVSNGFPVVLCKILKKKGCPWLHGHVILSCKLYVI